MGSSLLLQRTQRSDVDARSLGVHRRQNEVDPEQVEEDAYLPAFLPSGLHDDTEGRCMVAERGGASRAKRWFFIVYGAGRTSDHARD